MENKKEERSEYVGLYLTPTLAKQLKEAADNELLKDRILKNFITNETDWLKDEVKSMDEITTIYRAKLLTIKDEFTKAQDIYVKEIEELYEKTSEAMKPISKKFTEIKREIGLVKSDIESISKTVEGISSKIMYSDLSKVERLFEIIDRFNKLSETEKQLVQSMLERDK